MARQNSICVLERIFLSDRKNCVMWVSATRLAVLLGRNKPKNMLQVNTEVFCPSARKKNRGKVMAENIAGQNWERDESCNGVTSERMNS